MQSFKQVFIRLVAWFDNEKVQASLADNQVAEHSIDWVRVVPFVLMHLACFALFWVGYSHFALAFAIALYAIRMFAITGFYHRYFAHKAFQTSRVGQFLFAVLGATAVQRGPLWWASHHRNHHAHSDESADAHSPVQHGFLWSHIGWFLSRANFSTQLDRVKELAQFPELRFIDRYDVIVPIFFALSIFGLGELLSETAPHLNTNGWQLSFQLWLCITPLLASTHLRIRGANAATPRATKAATTFSSLYSPWAKAGITTTTTFLVLLSKAFTGGRLT
jgi:stearoyl-CoA desaturase (delta-9 desaturase)